MPGPAGRVQAGGRLGQDDQLRPSHESLGQLDALAHAHRVGVHRTVALLIHVHVVQDKMSTLLGRRGIESFELSAERDVLDRGKLGDVAVVLGHVADA